MTTIDTSAGQEQTFFPDPANDRMLAMLMALAAEVWVLKDRLRAAEALLEARGVLPRQALDTYTPDPRAEAAISAERQDFVRALMEPLFGRESTRGVPSSLRSGGEP